MDAQTRSHITRVKKHPHKFSREEEAQLIEDWHKTKDQKLVARLLKNHEKLVAKIARGYSGYGLPLSEMMSEGYIGMMYALKHFDTSKGFRFSTYAVWWIKAMINDYVLANVSLVKMVKNPHQKKLFFNLSKLEHKYGDKMTPEVIDKIAKELKVPPAEVIYMHGRMQKDVSLHASIKDKEGGEWIDWLADGDTLHEVEKIQEDEITRRKALIDDAMHCLNKREHDIFIKRRLKDPPDSLAKLADEFDVSRERVRQIEIHALDKLKKEMKRIAPVHFH